MQHTEATMMQSRRSNSERVAREAQLVELVVDGGFLFDVDVAGGNVGFGLVVVVIDTKYSTALCGKKRLELVVELRRQGLVVGQNQRGTVDLLDHLGHGEGLARTGDAQQDLVLVAVKDTAGERLDGFLLVAAGCVVGNELEVGHEKAAISY